MRAAMSHVYLLVAIVGTASAIVASGPEESDEGVHNEDLHRNAFSATHEEFQRMSDKGAEQVRSRKSRRRGA